MGVLLAGDLFARPQLDRRGGTGDVRDVWRAFAKNCKWIVGVAGNHDCFGEKPSLPDFKNFCQEPRIHFLDGEVVELDGLRIGGLSGIIGPPRKPFRRTEECYVDELTRLAAKAPDIVVLHDGPDIPIANLRGSPSIRIALEQTRPFLVIRGHAHWDNPLIRLANGGQVLNVDARLVMLVQ